MDANESYNIWYYPGSGMQRQPYEVYTLMYPQHASSTSFLNATSQSWQPATESSTQQEPQSFQEWKSKGCPYPDWFTSDHDPWYDDDGLRREMEEVFQLLYGEGAEEMRKKVEEEENEANPTPAELMSSSSNGNSGRQTTAETPTSGWASIAAKRPPPQAANLKSVEVERKTTAAVPNVTISVKKSRPVAIPKEVWLPDTANSDYFHMYPNPIERFNAVNAYHKPHLSTVKIPLCFDNHATNNSKGGKVALLDVHFQSAKTVIPVLNRFLPKAIAANNEVWIVTGSGQHVGVGHQRRESGGVLFNAVKKYLEEHEDELGLEFRIGKDTSGGKNKVSGGAFLVRKSIS
ncbi:hypothetical protein ACHAWC_008555 [Mediolabrus comicus]